MAFKKADLIAALSAKYLDVGTPALQASGPSTPPNTNWYIVNVTSAGLAGDGSPIAYAQNVAFYVYKEGDVNNEAAYYSQTPLQNGCDTLVAASTNQSYYNLYNSGALHSRAFGAMVKAGTGYLGGTVNQNYHWAQDFLKTPDKYVISMMIALSSNAAIRTAGNAVTDAALDTAVTNYIPIIATAHGITS
jgi:hypothetical protein